MKARLYQLVGVITIATIAWACTGEVVDEPPPVTRIETQGNSTPTGSIVGRVTDLRTALALGGAAVTVLSADEDGLVEIRATSSSAGAYGFSGLAAGAAYRVFFAKSGYVTRFADVGIPALVGDFPQGNAVVNLNMPLAMGDAALTGGIIIAGGAPASGAVVRADLRSTGFDAVIEATADAQGVYTLSGLPGAPSGLAVTVVVQPYDDNGDGEAEYNAVTRTGFAYPGSTSRLDVDLRADAQGVTLLSSDVDDSTHAATQPIDLTFNRPLDLAGTAVALRDLDINYDLAITKTLDGTGTVLTVAPAAGGTLSEGRDYRLTVNALATNGATATFQRFFQVVSATPGALPAVQNLAVTPLTPDHDTRTFSLTWSPVSGAAGYEVYARDDAGNPSYIRLATVGDTPSPSATVTLPASFDIFSADAWVTPFAFGTTVDFAVVAVDIYGNAASLGAATPVTRQDATAPSVVSTLQIGSADNTGNTSAATLELYVSYDEYMDSSTPATVTLPIGTMTATYQYNTNLVSGVFTITVPAGVDGTGTYQLGGARDSSGNLAADYSGTLYSFTGVIIDDFETGTADPSRWQPLPVYAAVVTDFAASGVYSLRVTSTGTATSQPINTTGCSVIDWSFQYKRGLTNVPDTGDDMYVEYYSSGGFWSAVTTVFGSGVNDASFIPRSGSITSASAMHANFAVRFQASTSLTDEYIYVDDVAFVCN